VDGKLIHTFNTGYSNLNKKIAATPQTCFRIASMTKSFTAMAILKLRDEGKLKLDDPAYLYVPEMKQQPYLTKDALPVTIRHLLTHTAGFPEDNPWGDRQLSMSDQTLINMIKKGITFSNDPGVNFEYSNLGYAILGYIIKKVSGQSYQKYITSTILLPLGMQHTYWQYSDVPDQELAQGYRWVNGEWIQEPLLKDGAFGAMAGLITSMEDFSKYVSFQLSAWPATTTQTVGPVKRSSLWEMQRPWNLLEPIPGYEYAKGRSCPIVFAYGYGFIRLVDCEGRIMAGHAGGLPGFGSDWLILPEYGIGIISLSNLTYAGVYLPNLHALDTLIALAKLKPRQLPTSAILNQRKNELIELLPNWNQAETSGIFANNFFMDYFPDSLRKESVSIFNRGGKIIKINEMIPINNSRGSFTIEAEKSLIEIFFTLTPQNPPLIQQFSIKETTKE
jgi:CubicO group peptidase (beta-lactamase class C family)